jgi:hypothetical protein
MRNIIFRKTCQRVNGGSSLISLYKEFYFGSHATEGIGTYVLYHSAVDGLSADT